MRTKVAEASASFTAAQTALRQLLGEHDQNGGLAHPSLTVTELVALFLDMVQAENSESTYYQFQRWLTEFAKVHGSQQARRINTLEGQQFNADFRRA
jgi:hypothetical protein